MSMVSRPKTHVQRIRGWGQKTEPARDRERKRKRERKREEERETEKKREKVKPPEM